MSLISPVRCTMSLHFDGSLPLFRTWSDVHVWCTFLMSILVFLFFSYFRFFPSLFLFFLFSSKESYIYFLLLFKIVVNLSSSYSFT